MKRQLDRGDWREMHKVLSEQVSVSIFISTSLWNFAQIPLRQYATELVGEWSSEVQGLWAKSSFEINGYQTVQQVILSLYLSFEGISKYCTAVLQCCVYSTVQ